MPHTLTSCTIREDSWRQHVGNADMYRCFPGFLLRQIRSVKGGLWMHLRSVCTQKSLERKILRRELWEYSYPVMIWLAKERGDGRQPKGHRWEGGIEMTHEEIGHKILHSIHLTSAQSSEYSDESFGSIKAGYFLISSENISFFRRALRHGVCCKYIGINYIPPPKYIFFCFLCENWVTASVV
jgi:hypothetical protein